MEDNKEHTWNKPTLNRSLSDVILSEDTDFNKKEFLYSFGNKFLEDVLLLEAGP